jgi:hypothetical protein
MAVERPHRIKFQHTEQASDHSPQFHLRPQFLPDPAEQPAAQLLDLIDQEGQHHQQNQNRGQIPASVAVIVLEMVALILQRIEGLILDLPSTTSGPHHFLDSTPGQGQICNLYVRYAKIWIFARHRLDQYRER